MILFLDEREARCLAHMKDAVKNTAALSRFATAKVRNPLQTVKFLSKILG
jgi:hypothetical protein